MLASTHSRHLRPDIRARRVSPARPPPPSGPAAHDAASTRETPLCDPALIYSVDADEFLYETFALTRSRVLLLARPQLPLGTCLDVMKQETCETMPAAYTVRKDWPGKREDGVWIVYGTHEEAVQTLALSHPRFAVLVPALETDLEPHGKLHCVAGSPRRIEMLSTRTPPRSPLACSTPSSATSSEYTGAPRTPLSAAFLNHAHNVTLYHTPSNLPTSTLNNIAYQAVSYDEKNDNTLLVPQDGRYLSVPPRLSSNPPNPRVSYRAGDWICPAVRCGAHNFGRNMSCIACGNPRCNAAAQRGPCLGANANANGPSNRANVPFANGSAPGAGAGMGQGFGGHPQQPTFVSPRFLAQHAEDRDRQRRPLALAPLVTSGARFAMPPPRGATSLPASRTASRNTSPARSPTVLSPHHSHFSGPPHSPHGLPHGNGGHGPHLTMNAKPHTPTYPLLTPSGHALSAGGRVRNISTDPASPCIMYWPDNEPLPERGQIRPLGSTVVQYPPIVNTGNKGAAEKQPGDWVCSKCNYLNWRRRKVCQTCYPYAEGNGDSISQAVQAERIALLTNLLNQTDTLALSRHASAPMHGQPASASATPRHTQPAPRHAASSVDLRRAYERDWEVPDRRRAFDEERRNNFEGHRSGLDYDAPRRLAFDQDARPIYQTPLHSRGASPAGSRRSPTSAFLPSCLDDVISDPVSPYDTPLSFHDAYSVRHSSSHGHGSGHGHSSPTTSTSSAELSFDEFPAYGYAARGGRPSFDSLYSASGASSRFDTDSTRFDLDSRRSYDSLRDDYARSAHHDSQQQRFAAPEDDVAFGTPEEDLRFRAPGGATRSGRRPSPRASTVWGEGGNYGVAGEGAFGVKPGEGALPEHTIAIQHPDQAWNLDGDESKTLLARAPIHADEVRELVGRFGRGLDLVTSA